MERTVLNSVGFRVNAPTAYTFWSIFRMSHAAADETSSLALYLTVRARPDCNCQHVTSGVVFHKPHRCGRWAEPGINSSTSRAQASDV